jgi:predicted transcriptional regulator
MRSAKSHGYYYLKCDTRHTSENACPGGFISVRELEQSVIDELQALLDENIDREAVENGIRLNNGLEERIIKMQSDKSAYEKKLAEISKAVKDSYMDKAKGLITETVFIEFSQVFAKEREQLEATVKNLDEDIVRLMSKHNRTQDKQQIVEEYMQIECLDRVMIEILIDHVVSSRAVLPGPSHNSRPNRSKANNPRGCFFMPADRR